jgi:hypothetical protein
VLRGEHVIVARGEMVERYTKAADQARLARNAMTRTMTTEPQQPKWKEAQ